MLILVTKDPVTDHDVLDDYFITITTYVSSVGDFSNINHEEILLWFLFMMQARNTSLIWLSFILDCHESFTASVA